MTTIESSSQVILGTEAPIQKEIRHGIAIAADRLHQPSARHVSTASAPEPAGPRANGSAQASTPGQSTPAALAAAAMEAGNYSLKLISREAARQAERELILKTLNLTRWNRKETAEILGISYKALLYKIKENGLDRNS